MDITPTEQNVKKIYQFAHFQLKFEDILKETKGRSQSELKLVSWQLPRSSISMKVKNKAFSPSPSLPLFNKYFGRDVEQPTTAGYTIR